MEHVAILYDIIPMNAIKIHVQIHTEVAGPEPVPGTNARVMMVWRREGLEVRYNS